MAASIGVTPAFRVLARQGRAAAVCVDGRARPTGRRVVAVAGIARPARFFDALRADGWDVAREMVFRDHHWFSHRDLAAIERAAADERADLIVTTEKDAARLDVEGRRGFGGAMGGGAASRLDRTRVVRVVAAGAADGARNGVGGHFSRTLESLTGVLEK